MSKKTLTGRMALLGVAIGALLTADTVARAQIGVALDDWKPAMAETASPRSLYGSYLAGRHAVNERDRESASRFFNEALERDAENRMLLEQAFAYSVSAGRLDRAAELAERLAAVSPGNIGANVMLGIGAMKSGDYEAARAAIADTDNGPIARLATGVFRAWTHVAGNDRQAALQALEDAGADPAFDSQKIFHRALMLELFGDVDEARRTYEAALEDGARRLRVVDAYGRFQERNGDPGAAVAAYDRFLSAMPAHPVILAARERALGGEPPEPLVKTASEGVAESLYTLGAVLDQDNGGDLAVIYLNFALALRPDFPVAEYLIGSIFERQRRLEAAVNAYDGIDDASPLKRQASIRAALSLEDLERSEEARSRLKSLIADDPTDASVLYTMGDVLRFRKIYEEATGYYTRAIEHSDADSEDLWRLHFHRGMTYERRKLWPQAEADLLRALELSEDQPLVLNYLGYTWIDMGMNLDRGLEMIRKAVEQRPNDGYIVDSLGWAYYRLGRFEEAVRELERAVEMQPGDPVLNDHLGDAYWKVGRKDEARFQWSHSLGMEPEPDEAEKTRAKLENGLPDDVPATETGSATDAAPEAAPAGTGDDRRGRLGPAAPHRNAARLGGAGPAPSGS